MRPPKSDHGKAVAQAINDYLAEHKLAIQQPYATGYDDCLVNAGVIDGVIYKPGDTASSTSASLHLSAL